MGTKNPPSWSEILVVSKSARDFFRRAHDRLVAENPRFTYASLARKAGFASRSLVGEIFAGKRMPSYKAFIKLTSIFDMSRAERDHLRYLIVRDYPKFDRTISGPSLGILLRKSCERLRPGRQKVLSTPLGTAGSFSNWARVYAACGQEKTALEVSRLAGLSLPVVRETLEEMLAVDLVSRDRDLYTSKESHIRLDSILHRKIIEGAILADCAALPSTISERYDDPEQLIFSGALSIRSGNLKKFKRRLKNDISQAIDQYFDPNGDALVTCHGLILK